MNRILGIPLKISADNSIYIPRSFWQYYGIPIDGPIVREELTDKLLFRSSQRQELRATEKLLRVHQGNVHLRPGWMTSHYLSIGDKVWLIGTEEGLVIYPHPANMLI